MKTVNGTFGFGMNRHGFSVLEMMVATSIGVVIMYAGMYAMRYVFDTQDKVEQLSSSTSQELLSSRQGYLDMRRGGISFNFMNQKSNRKTGNKDVVKVDKGFYDFVSEYECVPDPNKKEDCKRTFYLNKTNLGETFVVSVSEGGLSKPYPLNPTQFYSVTEPPDFNTAGTLSFDEAKFLQTVANLDCIDNTSGTGCVNKHNLLKPGRLLRFYSPITMTPPPPSPGVTPPALTLHPDEVFPLDPPLPRMVSLVAMVDGAGKIVAKPLSWLPTQRHASMPKVNFLTELNPLDSFFRLVPPVGGEQAFGMLMPIQVIRYRLEKKTGKGGKDIFNLVRETFNPLPQKDTDKWGGKVLLAENVKEVKFERKNISIASVTSSISMKGTAHGQKEDDD